MSQLYALLTDVKNAFTKIIATVKTGMSPSRKRLRYAICPLTIHNELKPESSTKNLTQMQKFTNSTVTTKTVNGFNRWLMSLVIAVMALAVTTSSQAQVTVTGDGAGGSPYANLQLAIAALPATLTQNTVISVDPGNAQTAPVGGYSITTTGTALFSLTITGNANTVTAPNPQTAGALNDAIFKIIGGDFITIQGFTMQENAANTTTAAATNNMTEWGVALLYASTTNGAQNVTIQNNTISLNRTYQNTFGIYSNSTHAATTVTTSASATTTAGGNSGLKIYSNNISNVNQGIVVVGPTAAADMNTGVEIGGALLGNTITNYGTTGTFSTYANVSGTVNGILVRNSIGYVISNNTVTSSVGGVTAGTLNGIQIPAASVTPTGTFTNNINNNNISLQSGLIGGAINGINSPTGSATATSTININNNNFGTTGHTVAGTGTIIFIIQPGLFQNISISNNTFTNITCNTTGSVTFISSSLSVPANGTQNINGNSIVTQFSKTGAGGTVTLFTNNGSSPATVTEQNNNNNFSNITVTGTTTIAGWASTDGGTPVKTITGNTFSNWTGGTGAITGLNTGFAGSATVSNNTISNISSAGAITGIASSSGTQTFTGNTVTGLSTTGASAVIGINNTGGTTQIYTKNTICNLQANNASGTVSGIQVTSGTTVTLSNNRIADLRTPASNAANPLIGINITGGTTVNAYYNTVLLNGTSSGALFGSSAISASTTPTLTLNNNIFINNSTVTGIGVAAAYRRSSTTLTSYASTSNRNDFFGTTIFNDGTNTDATLAAYKTRVGPSRDANAVSENASFLSTTCGNSDFLKINTATSTLLESGGTAIAGITDDFEGNIRNATTPDIGADEFNGTSPAPSVTFNSITPSTTQCVATARLVSVTATTPGGTTITGVTITYNNGTLSSNIPMTNTSGNIWEYTIPAATPTNTNVTWSATATNSIALTNTYVGASYQDDPLFGGVGSATASPATVCSGSTSNLTAVFVRPNQSKTVGTGGTTSTTTAASFFPGLWGGAKTQYIITAAELTAAGLGAGNITSLSFETTNSGQTYQGFTVQMGHTAQAAMTTTFIASGLTQVYKGTLTDDGYTPLVGVNALAFGTGAGSSASFTWNGSSNIVISICWSRVPAATTATATSMIVVPAGFTSSAYEQSDSETPAAMCAKTIGDGTGTNRPKFTFVGNGALPMASVSWNDGTSNIGTGNPFAVNPTVPTTYTPTGTDANGCTLVAATGASVSVLALPTAPGTGSFPSSQCGTGVPSGFVTGGAPGEYRWYTFDGISTYTLIPGETGASLTSYTISTTTNLYVAVNNGTCESAKTAVTANVVAPDAITANASPSPVCANSTLNLSVTQTGSNQNYAFTWSASPATGSGIATTTPGAPVTGAASVTPTAAGTYSYIVNAVDGPCATSANISVVVNPQPTIDSITASPNPVCAGSPVSLNVYSAGGGFVNGPQTPPTGYCTATFSSTTEDDIGQVTFAGINNPAVRPSPQQSNAASVNTYTDFTGTTAATVQKGASFPITVYHFHDGTDVTANFCNVYIDFNRNGVFTDAGETFSLTKVGGAFLTDFTGTIAIPTTASIGVTRMRVVLREGAITTPCGSIGTWGEAEDYLVNIQTVNPQNPTLTYSWSPATGSTPSVTDIPSADPTVYTATVSNGTCSIAPTVSVAVLPLPDAPLGTNSQQCGTGVPTASVATGGANGSGVFKWYIVPSGGTAIAGESGTSLVNYTISIPTSFYVSEVGTNGCESPRTQVDVTFDLIPDDLTLSASPSPICLGQSTTFTVGQTGGNNSFIFNYPSVSHVAGSGINIPNIDGIDSNLINGNITITPTAAGTYTYTVRGFDPDKGCISIATTTVTVNPLPSITSFTVTPSPICEGGTINLKGEVIAAAPGSATIGTQTTTEFGGGVYRYGAGTGDFRHQLLYTASELTAAGFVAGNITSATFTVTSAGSGSANNYTIKLGHTAATAFTTAFQASPSTTCYIAPTYTAVAGNNVHAFTTPFAWDGVSNIIVEICYNISATGSTSTVAATTPASISNTSRLATAGACTAATGNTFANRPLIAFAGQVGTNQTGNYTWVFNPGSIAGGTTGMATTLASTGITAYTVTATNNVTSCSITSPAVNITVNPIPAAPTASGVTRCGPGAVSLAATAAGGGTLNWYTMASGGTSVFTGSPYAIANVPANSSYWVAETNPTTGCEGPRTQVDITLTTPPTLAITPGGATTFCAGGSVSLDAAASPTDASYINFSWSPGGATTPSITANPSVTTIYTVTADDGVLNGCSNTATITVTVNPNPVINTATATPATICTPNSSTLTAISGTGTLSGVIGTGTTSNTASTPYKGFWGGHKVQMLYTAAELAALGMVNGSGIESVGFNISAFTSPYTFNDFQIAMKLTNITALTTTLETGVTNVFPSTSFTLTGTAPFTTAHNLPVPFIWDGTSNLLVEFCFNNADGGGVSANSANVTSTSTSPTNRVSYFSSDNYADVCTIPGVATLSTTRPNLRVTHNLNLSGNFNWQWVTSPTPNSPVLAAGNSVTVSPTTTQAYTVTATNPVTSCATTSAVVTVNVLTVTAVATAAPSTLCVGQSSTLSGATSTGGLPLTYEWRIQGNPSILGTAVTLVVSPTATTVYELTVKDACNNPSVTTVTVTVNPVPSVTVSPVSTSLCVPGASAVTLTAAGADTYTWTPAAGLSATTGASVDALPSTTTTYQVTGADANGCTDTAFAVVNIGNSVQSLTAIATPSVSCPGAPVVLTANSTAFGPAGGYLFATSTGAALDPMTGAIEIVADSTDDTPMNLGFSSNTTAGNAIPIGFTFNMNGTDFSHFAASPDGWVTFGNSTAAPTSDFGNGVTDATNIPKVYPYWDDIATGVGGNVRYVVTGSAPNRILVVEWFVTIPRVTTGAANSRFQAWMYEGSGKVEFRYGTMNTGSMSASVGITGSATQYQSVTVSANTASNSSANNSNAGQPASGRLYSFAPAPVYFWNPGSLTGSSVTVNPTATTIYTLIAVNGFCSAAQNVTVTVNPATAVTVDAAPATQLAAQNGTPANLTFTAVGTNLTYQWYSNTTNSTTGGTSLGGGATSNTYTPSTTANGTIYYYAVVTGDCGLDTTSAVEVNVVDANTNIWTGIGGSNWSTPGSWSLNAVPTTLNDAIIPTGNTPYPILSATSTAKNLEIQAGATVSLNGQTLNIVSSVDPAGTGTFIGSNTSNLSVGANSTLRFATGAGGVVRNLTLNAGTTTLATALDITAGTALNTNGVVTVASGATLASGGNLTFKSNQFGTARLAQGATTGQWVTGDVTVERYIPANAQRAWRFLSVPTKGTQTINQAWQEGATPSNFNPKPNFGTRLTTSQLAYSVLGFDERTTKTSIQFFNQASGTGGAWVDVSSTLNGGNRPSIESVKGYSVYVRGERTQAAAVPVTSTTPTTLRTRGTLYTGNQAAITVGSGRFDLIGNTYVSPIDFLGLSRTGIANSFYLWDPKLVVGTPPNQSLGGYVTFSLANGWVGVPNSSSYGLTPRTTIQPGESFMIQANAGGGSITLNEGAKVVGDGLNFFRPAAPTTGFEKMKANLFTVDQSGDVMADANVSVFDNIFSNAVDGDDAIKLSNAGENFAIRRNGVNLVVEGRQLITSYDTTNYWIWGLRQGIQYRMELIAENMNIEGRTAFLIDNYLNSTTQLDLAGGVTNYNFTINADNLSSAINRFRILYRQVAPSPVPVSFVTIGANKAGNTVKVDWKVAAESGIRNYVVERSANGRSFTGIGTVTATGNTGGEKSYTFTDAAPLADAGFYRIKSTGINGEIKYSAIVKVVSGNILPSFTIAPNPVEGSVVNVQFKNQAAGRYAFRLMATTGEAVFTAIKEHAGGSGTQVMNLPAGLARGAYQLEIISPDKQKEVQTLFINTLK